MRTEEKKAVIDSSKINEKDCGSADVQIALLTKRIAELSGHLSTHLKDHHTRHGLLLMVGKRKRLISYLKRTEPKRYAKLAGNLGIK
ncbi:MAG: 30S ribosomal protein S15 [Candidatus Saganbacteria bacterium]|nr:30S ribosomal protein S15 [Candidatus Saganbacteria bacterium]